MEKIEEIVRKTYRVDEIANLLGVSRSGAYKLINEGYIRCIRAGKLILVPVEALDEFLQKTGLV